MRIGEGSWAIVRAIIGWAQDPKKGMGSSEAFTAQRATPKTKNHYHFLKKKKKNSLTRALFHLHHCWHDHHDPLIIYKCQFPFVVKNQPPDDLYKKIYIYPDLSQLVQYIIYKLQSTKQVAKNQVNTKTHTGLTSTTVLTRVGVGPI